MKKETFCWLLANLLIFTASCIMLSGCMTYQKALNKFGNLAKDSTRITFQDTVITKMESTSLALPTDTTTIYKVVEQGKARIIYDRTRTITRVQAECLPDTIIRTITKNGPPKATFGIAPWYKTWFYILLGIIVAMLLAYLFSYLFKLRLSITRR